MTYNRSVFVNCPYDDSFAPVFHAIILTVVALDFEPHSAKETEGDAEPRMLRIARGISDSKYSIHDLSRYSGEGPDNLARFNMPLELGMALAFRYERSLSGRVHNWVALVPPGFVHFRFVSDLSGYDSPAYDGSQVTVIRAVSAWLALQPDCSPAVPHAREILDALPEFNRSLAESRHNALDFLSWPAILKCAVRSRAAMRVPDF